jgi:nanoRNase/pAp phosphatase (c-di-AMP/oligoRNAs hydrolase)
MGIGNFWKYGLAVGAGVAIGAIGAMMFSRGNVDLKKCASTLLSHGMDLKDKASEMMETAKENLDDLAAEARSEQSARRNQEQSS